MTSKTERMGKLLSGAAVGTPGNPFVLKDPLVVIFQQDGDVVCNIHRRRVWITRIIVW
jgi:hypothetical protein